MNYWSDERQRNRENWPRPFGLRRESGHPSLLPSTVGSPQPSDSASSPPHGRRPVRGGPGSGRIFARNAARQYMSIRPRTTAGPEGAGSLYKITVSTTVLLVTVRPLPSVTTTCNWVPLSAILLALVTSVAALHTMQLVKGTQTLELSR